VGYPAIWGLRRITSTALPERMKDDKKTNPNCFGEGDRNLPNSNQGNEKVIIFTPAGKGSGYAQRDVQDHKRRERRDPRLP